MDGQVGLALWYGVWNRANLFATAFAAKRAWRPIRSVFFAGIESIGFGVGKGRLARSRTR